MVDAWSVKTCSRRRMGENNLLYISIATVVLRMDSVYQLAFTFLSNCLTKLNMEPIWTLLRINKWVE